MARYDPILFDLDGTLIDSGPDIVTAVNHTLGELGVAPLAPERIIGMVGDGVRRLMQRVLQQESGPQLDDAVARFKAHYRRHCLVATRAYPGIPELLERLGGLRLAVVTNKPHEFACQVLAGLDLLRHFGAVVGGDEALLKPRPEPLLLALQRLDAPAARAIMVGDFANDVLAGQAAGLATCGTLWGFDAGSSLSPHRPDHRCRSAAELERLLLG